MRLLRIVPVVSGVAFVAFCMWLIIDFFNAMPLFEVERNLVYSSRVSKNSDSIEVYHIGAGATTKDFIEVVKVDKQGNYSNILKREIGYIPDEFDVLEPSEQGVIKLVMRKRNLRVVQPDTLEIGRY